MAHSAGRSLLTGGRPKRECPAGGLPSSDVCKDDCFRAGKSVKVVDGKTVLTNCLGKTISWIAVDPGCKGKCTTKYEEARAAATPALQLR